MPTEQVLTAAPRDELYGLLAEFADAGEILTAARRAHQAGFVRVEAYSPIPLHGLAEALGKRRTRLPFLTLLGGVLGAVTGYGMQFWATVTSYPINVGGRPLHSWPAFIPVTFALTVLVAGLFAVFGMLALNGLPMPYHPVFNAPSFSLATHEHFYLCIEARDPKFDSDETRRFLDQLSPRTVAEVEL
jgi:hypothetical protein